MACLKRFELVTPKFVVWCGPLKSLRYVTERSASFAVLAELSGSRCSNCYRKTGVHPEFSAQ